jgi:Fe-S cluster biogenesis protein NfuA
MTSHESGRAVVNDTFQRHMQQIEALVEEIERAPDPRLRERAQELVRCLMELHKEGLNRVLDIVGGEAEAARRTLERLSADVLVANMLMLHDLHPIPFDQRVRRAVDSANARLRRHGANVDLVEAREGHVVVRIAAGSGCGSTAGTVKQAVEEALFAEAPDLKGFEIEEASPRPAVAFVPLQQLKSHQIEGVRRPL